VNRKKPHGEDATFIPQALEKLAECKKNRAGAQHEAVTRGDGLRKARQCQHHSGSLCRLWFDNLLFCTHIVVAQQAGIPKFFRLFSPRTRWAECRRSHWENVALGVLKRRLASHREKMSKRNLFTQNYNNTSSIFEFSQWNLFAFNFKTRIRSIIT
jgi:hypothetical protein